MKKNRLSLVISLILLVLVISLIGFMIYRQTSPKTQVNQERGLLSLTIEDDSLSQGEIEQYQRQFDKFVEMYQISSTNTDAIIGIGVIKNKVDDHAGAEEAWILAIQTDPNLVVPYLNLASLYTYDIPNHSRVVDVYEVAVLNSYQDAALNVLIFSQYADYLINVADDLSAAETVLLRGIELNPESSNLMIMLGALYEQMEQPQKALQYYRQALEVTPGAEGVQDRIDEIQNN